ncbi:single-stranded DNA-binding protein [Erysipelothrix anatis]|uniref:single-stranded DNA-binding protein n=1 Tax=Erysipelothrix anatis TaxID=2683713 RepID=UPI001409A402|nr:single-stranded DNA-binding protein [Erysipelothrix anatis]
MNKFVATGTIFNDPYFSAGNDQKGSFIAITLSVKNNFKSKKTGKYEYQFLKCVAYGKTADFINTHFKAGKAIEITDASLVNNNYEQNGIKVYEQVVKIKSVEFGVGDYVEKTQQIPQPEYSTEEHLLSQFANVVQDEDFIKRFESNYAENEE